MARVVDKYTAESSRTVIICDFSPPRGASPELLEPARHLDADFVSVAYNPGKSTRISSAIAAHWIKANTGKDVVFTLATRDMNKLALQSLLLGAALLGLENVVAVKGDDFNERDLAAVKDVNDYKPTELIRAVVELNQGLDYKGLKLRGPTHFCVGASIDMGRGIEREVRLARLKVEAGAQFFLAQPSFSADNPREFMGRYADQFGEGLSQPVFYGVQVMAPDSLVFSSIPQWVSDDLARGRAGQDIALQVFHELRDAGIRSIYLIPPVLRGGVRDYEAAQRVLAQIAQANT